MLIFSSPSAPAREFSLSLRFGGQRKLVCWCWGRAKDNHFLLWDGRIWPVHPHNTVDLIFFYAKRWTVADQKPMVKIWKIMGWSALYPKIKKRRKKPSGSCQNHLPPFFEDFGVFRRQMCPVTSGQVDNCVHVGQRPHACLTICGSGVHGEANARHYRRLQILFLDEKVSSGYFQPLSFIFISRNNGSWAF